MKTCSKCHSEKPLTEFGVDVTRNGHRRYCNECRKEYARFLFTMPKHKETYRNYWRSPAGKITKRKYESSQKHKTLKRIRQFRYKYGLLEPDYRKLFETQGGKCAICRKPAKGEFSLNVDHDHETGRIRGLLCNGCNGGLGLFRDDPALLTEAIDYLIPAIEDVAV